MTELLTRCRVVLVRTQFPGNLGATARVMRNLGFCDLVLVAPEADRQDRQARQMSTHGEAILDQARVCSTLEEAVGDCLLVAATSARIGGPFRRQSVGYPEEVAARLVSAPLPGPVGIVFGPERTGLLDEEVGLCHWLIHIPAEESYPALNLAQSVAICLYEVRRAWMRATHKSPTVTTQHATFDEQDRLFQHLRQALEVIHFLYDERADALMFALRHLIARAQPTSMEVRLLHGLARQLQWIARHGPTPSPPEDSN